MTLVRGLTIAMDTGIPFEAKGYCAVESLFF